MPRDRDAVHDAISRWAGGGLIDEPLAESLRAEVSLHTSTQQHRWSQYALAVTGAAVTLIAAGVFLEWAWPVMGAGARSLVLGLVAVALAGLGMAMESRHRWIPVAYLLQTAGLVLLLVTYAYSREAWRDASPGGVLVGIAAFVTPLVAAASAPRRNAVMPAVQTALAFAYIYLFLDRATPLHHDVIVWILDAVLLLSIVLFVVRLRRTDPGDDAWVLNAFVASLYAAMVLIVLTMAGPLNAGDEAAFALDAWLIAVTGLTLWGIHRAPPGLQRAWYDRQLALCVLMGVLFAFWTVLGPMDGSELAASLAVAGVGALALRYGLAREVREVIATGCLALLTAALYFGITQGGALGAVLALAVSAAFFFWLSARLGGRGAG